MDCVPGGGYCCNKFLQDWKWPWQWAVGRGWKNIETHHRKGLDFLEHTVSTDMNANNSAIEDSGGSEEHCRENTSSSRMAKSSGTDCWQKYECQRHYPWGLAKMEWRKKGDPCHLVTESSAELRPIVTLKSELVSDELGQLVEQTSKQSVEDAVRFLLAAFSKIWEERERSREELLSKMGDLGSSQPIQM